MSDFNEEGGEGGTTPPSEELVLETPEAQFPRLVSANPYGDRPRAEAIKMAELALKNGGNRTIVYFKFTCAHCEARNTFADPNTLYESGECSECGETTLIEKAGFMLILVMDPDHKRKKKGMG